MVAHGNRWPEVITPSFESMFEQNLEPMFELIGARTGNCQRVAIAFEEAGLPYRVRLLDLAQGEQRAPSHLALNPAGKVPVLRMSGAQGEMVLTQSNAIMLYLAERAPGTLVPVQPAARALAIERFFYFVTDVIAVSHAGFALRGAHPGENALATATLSARVGAAIEYAAQFVATDPFMAGEQFTLADISAWTIVNAARALVQWDTVPALDRWFKRLGTRPSIERGMQAFEIADP